MRYGNLLQLLAIIALFALTIFEYRQSKDYTQEVIYRLRVQKSFSNRQSFEYEYGKDYKNVIKEKIEENNQLLLTLWNQMMYKFIVVILLALVSIFHFIKYFYIDYDVEHETLPMHRYDASTWFLNFLYFAFVSVWYAYFSQGYTGASIGYVLGILCATKCLWHVSIIVQTLKIKSLTAARVLEMGIATLIYFHLIGFILMYYFWMIMGPAVLINVLKNA